MTTMIQPSALSQQMPPKPLGMMPSLSPNWLSQLGRQTQVDPTSGLVYMNVPFIESLARQGQQMIPGLYQLLGQSQNRNQILEGLFLGQRLAELKIPGIQSLYGAASRFNTTTDPLIQIYLAGFYRALDVPDSFGPMVQMLIRQAYQPPSGLKFLNPAEEIGGTILSQIASASRNGANKTGFPQ